MKSSTGFLRATSITVGLFTTTSAPAQLDPMFMAQQSMPVSFSMSNAMLSQTLLPRPDFSGSTRGRPQDRAYPSGGLRTGGGMTFTPSASVSRAVREEVRQVLYKSSNEPAFRREVDKAMATDAVWRAFAGLIAKAGYSSTNLIDVVTAYYVVNWEVVSGRSADHKNTEIAAVRRQLGRAFAADPRLAKASDAEKQRTAETMGILAALAGAAQQELLRAGDAQTLARLRASVREGVKTQGVDLAMLDLTFNGLVPKM